MILDEPAEEKGAYSSEDDPKEGKWFGCLILTLVLVGFVLLCYILPALGNAGSR